MFEDERENYYFRDTNTDDEDKGHKVITEYSSAVYNDGTIKSTIKDIINKKKQESEDDDSNSWTEYSENVKLSDIDIDAHNKNIKQLQKELYKLRKLKDLDDKSRELKKAKLEKIKQAKDLLRKIDRGDVGFISKEDIAKFADSNPNFWRTHSHDDSTSVKELIGVVKYGEGSTTQNFLIRMERLKRKITKKF